jgi:hypothetical protein
VQRKNASQTQTQQQTFLHDIKFYSLKRIKEDKTMEKAAMVGEIRNLCVIVVEESQ